jgi:hypothetical protein
LNNSPLSAALLVSGNPFFDAPKANHKAKPLETLRTLLSNKTTHKTKIVHLLENHPRNRSSRRFSNKSKKYVYSKRGLTVHNYTPKKRQPIPILPAYTA